MSRRFQASALVLGLVFAAGADAATVNARMRRDKKSRAGTDAEGRVLLFTPKPIQVGSTHSHFDTSASPNLLMEPSASSDLEVFDVDLKPGKRLVFRYRPSQTHIRDILRSVNGAGLTIGDLSTSETDLEDIFLSLTRADNAANG